MIITSSMIFIGFSWLIFYMYTRLESANLLKIFLSLICSFLIGLLTFFALNNSQFIFSFGEFIAKVIRKFSFSFEEININTFSCLGISIFIFICMIIIFYFIFINLLKNLKLKKKAWKYSFVIINTIISMVFLFIIIGFVNNLYKLPYGFLEFIFDKLQLGMMNL